jgi:hypothetical protein
MQFISQINQICKNTQELILASDETSSYLSEVEFENYALDAYFILYQNFHGIEPSFDKEQKWEEIKALFLKEKNEALASSFTYNELVNMFFFHQDSFHFFYSQGFDFSKPAKEGENFNLYHHLRQDGISACNENFMNGFDHRLILNGFLSTFIQETSKKTQKGFFLYSYMNSSFNEIFKPQISLELMNQGLKISLEEDKALYAQMYLDHGANLGDKIYDLDFKSDKLSHKTQLIYQQLFEAQKIIDEKRLLEKKMTHQNNLNCKIKI